MSVFITVIASDPHVFAIEDGQEKTVLSPTAETFKTVLMSVNAQDQTFAGAGGHSKDVHVLTRTAQNSEIVQLACLIDTVVGVTKCSSVTRVMNPDHIRSHAQTGSTTTATQWALKTIVLTTFWYVLV